MGRIISCMIGFFLFGVLYAEIFNALKILKSKVNVYLFAGAISLVYLIRQLILDHFEKRAPASKQDEIRFKRIRHYYHICLAFLAFILLVAVPCIWWGSILKVSIMANKGIR